MLPVALPGQVMQTSRGEGWWVSLALRSRSVLLGPRVTELAPGKRCLVAQLLLNPAERERP